MNTFSDRDYRRSPGFLHAFREETQRMTAEPPPAPAPAVRDEAALLPLLLLLMLEGADKWLLLAFVYILM